jgi:ABC-type nitrate/sulfonate/bicarbonate transport system substrate-binding protein
MLICKRQGWDCNRDLSLLGNGSGGELIKSGRVDAFTADEIAVSEAVHQGYRDLVDTAEYKFVMPGSGINALKDWLPGHRETAERFVKSSVEAIALIKHDKQAAFAAMAKWYGITNPAQQEQIWAQAAALPSKPYPSVDGIKQMMAVYNWREMSIHQPEDFYDASFITALDKSGYIDSLYGGPVLSGAK